MNTQTENGDKALATTGNQCLDFFVRITRSAQISDYLVAFDKAWDENVNTAVRILMNMRDCRSGKGEKLIPVVILTYIKLTRPSSTYEQILRKMVTYGYWKDLLKIMEIESRYCIEQSKKSKPQNSIEVTLFAEQLTADYKLFNESVDKKAPISLCAKWAPSEKSHYDHHPIFAATQIMKQMSLAPKDYRQMLTKLRNHLNVLEMLMCTQQFDKIDFAKLPSVASMKMKEAFKRDTNSAGKESDQRKKLHATYQKYLEDLAKGKSKVNVKGIHPHEIVSSYINDDELDVLAEAQWTTIREAVAKSGSFKNVTAVVDVSGSMSGEPMAVSIALGILVAECTTGPYHGQVITFHETPSWHKLVGSNLRDQVKCMEAAPWGGSTNLRAVFDLILCNAKSAKLTPDEMIKTLFIFTDMQFNQCDRGNWQSTFEYAKQAYLDAGYILPQIICWNLRTSSTKSLPISSDEQGFMMLSGFSAELLKCVLTGEEMTPLSMMMHVLEPYEFNAENCGTRALFNESQLTNLTTAIGKSAIKKSFNKSPKAITPVENNADWSAGEV